MLSIHKAVAENSIQRVQKLIDEGANVNASGFEIRHNGKCTPLQVGAYKGYEDITELLILNGAMLEAKNQRGETGYKYKSDVYRPTKRITKDTPATFNELSKKELESARREKAKKGRVKQFKN